MKKSLFYSLLTFAVIGLTVSSCKKDDNNDNNNTTQQDQNLTPEFNDADGLLAALKTITFKDLLGVSQPISLDVGLATFFNGSSGYFDAGAVSVNSNDLDKLSNNTYISQLSSGTTSLGFSTTSVNDWNVAGSSDVQAFTHSTTSPMPSDMAFDGDYKTLDISTDLTVSIQSAPANADSMLFHLVDNKGTSILITRPAGTTSYTFTAAQLSGLSKGANGLLQVVAYNFEKQVVGMKNMYFVNEVVISELPTLE